MEVVYPRCCGLDIHKKTIAACLIVPGDDGAPRKEVRTFGTMTEELLALGDWLASAGCTHVAMESTGVYWKPIYNLLEGSFTLLLVNAQHVKAVPGRKTDVKDCEWIADLLRHGLLRASFVPDRAQRELRELTRYRAAKVRERAREVVRLQQTLEGANIKLGAVATDILGKSGRQILAALVDGATDAAALAELARGRLRAKLPQLERALAGRFGAHQRFLVAEQLAQIDALEAAIARLSAEIAERLRPFEAILERLETIPGVGRRVAEVVVAEVGVEMARFATAAHLASWAGLCPGNDESAGKRRSGKTRKGNRWLRGAVLQAAWGAIRTKGSYFGAQFRRIAKRRGEKRAAVAVAHSLLTVIYHVLTRGVFYEEAGAAVFERREPGQVADYHRRRLEELGYEVRLEPKSAA
jgi:transposase